MGRRAKYRSQQDIFASLLETAENKGKMGITKMAYDSRLSHHQIHMHIGPMVKGHLLDQQANFYSITEKGKKFLRLYSDLVEMIKDKR
jgi:predicted transcriptional regulator